MAGRKHPVSIKPILRELRKTLKKLHAKKKGKIPRGRQKAIDYEIKVLERCEDEMDNVFP